MKTRRPTGCRHAVHSLAFVTLLALAATATAADRPLNMAEFTANPLEVAKGYTTEVSLKNFKSTKKVAIAMAAVTFKLESNISAKAINVLGGSRTGTASSAMTMALNGVSKEALQQIADAFHDQLAADFKALGVEIVPAAAVKGSPKFAAFAALNDTSHRQPYVNKNYAGTRATLMKVTGYDMPLVGTGLAGMGPAMKPIMALSTDLGTDVAVVYADVTVDFVAMSAGGGLLAVSAEVSGKPTLNIPLAAGIGFMRGYYGGALGVRKPIVSAADYGAQVKEAKNVRLSDWISGNNASRATYVVDADEAKFKAGVGEMLKAVSQMFTARIKEKIN